MRKREIMGKGRSVSFVPAVLALTILFEMALAADLRANQTQEKKAPAPKESIVGKWSVTITEFGEEKQSLGPIPIKLKIEEDKLSGVFVTPRMGDLPLENLKFDGENLSFRVSNGERYFEFEMKLKAENFEGSMTVSGATMSGKAVMTKAE